MLRLRFARNRREARASDQPSHNHDNLPNYLSIAISELFSSMNPAWIGVNHQAAILPAAAPAQIGSVTFENDVQRLLPQRFRAAVVELLLLSVHYGNQPTR